MCRTATPDQDIVKCSRCGLAANPSDGWEHGWPLYGRIEIGFPSCLPDYWNGSRGGGIPKIGAVKECSFQDIVLEWGNGYRYDSTGKYRLCYECQGKLLQTLGEYFKEVTP